MKFIIDINIKNVGWKVLNILACSNFKDFYEKDD